ncbi:Short-chain dehydrogenase TIC 32, chloroplastic [Paramyrothecium foliicola]|nr:Short-chain dehydrogenase TIC 32, chloroplastic [Paramyrothecium foliicola]
MAKGYTDEITSAELATIYADAIKGKTILATGVTPGSIGANYVESVAASGPALIILAGRSADKLRKEADIIASRSPGVQTRSLVLDLGSLAAVRKAADEVNSWDDVPAIDVVCNCAGVMAVPFALTPDGVESQFAMNHLGPFLFTNLIMDKVLAAPAPRVVMVSSDGHRTSHIRWADINFDNGYSPYLAYGQSKTANMLMALSLAEKLGKRGLLSFSLHPGVIFSTGLASHLDLDGGAMKELVDLDHAQGHYKGDFPNKPISVEQGAATQTYASFEPTLSEHNGAYLQESRVGNPYTDMIKPWATSPIEADKLWKLSEELVGQKFAY